MHNRRNYYRVLHVQPDAPTEIIRMSYLTLMQRMKKHPDLGGDHLQASLINEAFAVLVDPERRAAYDRSLARDRALPGYRTTAARHADQAAQQAVPRPAPGVDEANACSFCGAPCSSRERRRIEATCARCDSPLFPAARHEPGGEARRAVARFPRRLSVTFYLAWPQPAGFSGQTEDVSMNGMRFTSDIDLIPNERIKIDCSLCAAVAIVRHSRVAPGTPGRWDVGVEFLTLIVKPSRGVLVSAQA